MKTNKQSSHLDENCNFGLSETEDLFRRVKDWIEKNNYYEGTVHNGRVSEDCLNGFVKAMLDGRECGVDLGESNQSRIRPDWLDVEKLKTGQQFAQEFYSSICFSELVCLLLVMTYDNVLRKLIWTGKSSDAYAAFKRYLSTGRIVRTWFTSDLFDEGSDGYKNLAKVNLMHRSFYKRLDEVDESEFVRSTELNGVKSTICPFVLKDVEHLEFPTEYSVKPKNLIPMCQTEMAATQFSFIGLLVLQPEKFGVCPIKYAKGLDGFVHLWRYIAYRLGTSDKYNMCAGTYDEVKAKCQMLLDFVLKPGLKKANHRWEHMTRSIVEGLFFYLDCSTYEAHLMFGFHLLDMNFIHLYDNSSLKSKLQFQIMKVMIPYLMPFSWFRKIITNAMLEKIDKVSDNMPTEQEFNKKVPVKKATEGTPILFI